MSKTTVLLALGLIAAAFAQTAGTCTTMYNGLKCRTISQDPSKMDAGAVSGARGWLCTNYPEHCTQIVSNGQYVSCNSVEQLSNAMNSYYTKYQSQGNSACNFGGVAVIVSTPTSSAAVATTAASGTPAATVASTTQCQNMYAQASCRTASQDPTQVDAGAVTSSRNWLCGAYPQFCNDIQGSGAYTSCNSVQQLSYAMSLYYNNFKSQGTSACNFGGIGKVNSGSSAGRSTTGGAATTTASNSGSSGVDCTAMYKSLACRTSSQSVDAGTLSGAKSWLCTNYAQYCSAINSGGQYSSCNAAEQFSYAANAYYNAYSSQGSSACSFGGVVSLVSSGSSSGSSGSGSGVVANPTPSPALSSKAGLAWPIDQFHNGSPEPSLAPWATGKISWIYTWGDSPAPLAISSTNLEWVPMLHGSSGFNSFIAQINSGAYDNVKNILLFNEPDLDYPPYAYALDVNTAVQLSIQVFQAMNNRGKSWRVGTPAMSYNMGWLQNYMGQMASQCPTCKFSFVPIHAYTTDSNGFKNTVQNYYNTFRLPVWITEWADTDFSNRNYQMSMSHIQNYMSDTTGWLNAQSWVERYSWFGTMRAVDVQDKGVMTMNSDGSRNALGDQYVLRGGAL